MTDPAAIERVARAIVQYRIDTASAEMLEGYGIPFGAEAEKHPAERDAAEAAAIDESWPAWRLAACSFIEAARPPVEVGAVKTIGTDERSRRIWQPRSAEHDRRRSDRRKA